MSWLSEIEKKIANKYEVAAECGGDELALDVAIEDGKQMAPVIGELAASGPLLQNIYTSMFMSESRNEGLPPQVQYWLQEIPKFLDNLSPDAKALAVPTPEKSEFFPVIYGKLDEYPEGRCELVLEFWQDLKDDGKSAMFFSEPYVAYSYPIFGISTKGDCIFDDEFWDIFHQYPFHICHILVLDSGLFDVRFKVASKPEKTDGD